MLQHDANAVRRSMVGHVWRIVMYSQSGTPAAGHGADGGINILRGEQCAKHDSRARGHRSHLLVPSMAEQSHPYGV